MIEFKINAETDKAKHALVQFLDNYKETIVTYINTIIGNDGTPVDAGITVDGDDNVTIYQLAPDKGYVLGEEKQGELPMQLKQYKNVETGDRYIVPEQDRIVLHIKTEQGKPDVKLGVFKTLSDAVTEFNSDSVKEVIKNYNDRENAIAKREAKQEAKMKKLAASKAKAEPVANA